MNIYKIFKKSKQVSAQRCILTVCFSVDLLLWAVK